jgi:hypothetical protein
MEKVLKDERFLKLLKEKQRLEIFSMFIPFLGIIALLVFLYLFSKSMLVASIILLGVVLTLVISQYIFDSIISKRIEETYLELIVYFQEQIVPRLLKRDNETLVFDKSKNIDISVIDAVDLFNRFKTYNSRFHYEAMVDDKKVIFDELLFDHEVDYNTNGVKEFESRIDEQLNYHVYQFESGYDYQAEALFVFNGFEELSTEDISTFSKIDIGTKALGIRDEVEFSFYLKDNKKRQLFMKEKIIQLFKAIEFRYNSLLIHVNGNKVTVILEEFENLINPPHSKKFTIEKLLHEYKEEQRLIKKIMNAFEL